MVWLTLPAPLAIDLDGGTIENQQFFLTYNPTISPKPFDTKFNCGCGTLGKVNVWNTDSYKNLESPVAKHNWLEWMLISGTTGSDITKRLTSWNYNSYNYGLFPDVEFTCKSDDMICDGSLDFVNDELALVMAYTIRFKAGEILVEKILSSPNLSRFTMNDRERLYGMRNHYRTEFTSRIQFLGDALTEPERINLVSDCLSCKDPMGFTKGKIRIT